MSSEKGSLPPKLLGIPTQRMNGSSVYPSSPFVARCSLLTFRTSKYPQDPQVQSSKAYAQGEAQSAQNQSQLSENCPLKLPVAPEVAWRCMMCWFGFCQLKAN